MEKINMSIFEWHSKPRTKEAFLVMALSVFIVSPCAGQPALETGPSAEPTLRFVSIIHRHGDRAPEENSMFPLFPYKGKEHWPNGLGALMKSGKRNMYELGRYFRERYDGFISPIYSPVEARFTSNDIERCITSAQLVVAGLYPPVGNETWKSDLLWEPVPVHTLTPACDDMIRVSRPCALLLKEEREQEETMDKRKLAEIGTLLPYLSKNTGREIKTTMDAYHVYDYFFIVEQQGLPLPQWYQNMTDVMASFFRKLSGIHNDFKETPTEIKLQTGVLINEILSNMERKAYSSDSFERRLNLYSAQDNNIVRVWRAMDFSPKVTKRPPYAAALIFELHEIDDKYRVKILFKNGSADMNLTVLKPRGCNEDPSSEQDEMCDLTTFSSALRTAVITDFDEACKIPNQSS